MEFLRVGVCDGGFFEKLKDLEIMDFVMKVYR